MSEQNMRAGLILMVATMAVFAIQDAMSRHLAASYNVFMVVMIRFWFFAAFVIVLAVRKAGGLAAAARTSMPLLQAIRGALLVAEICVTVAAFVLIGLVQTHAVFSSYPLMVVALSGPVLGEKVGWRRWSAVAVGFVGVIVILEPGFGVFDPWAIVALIGALMFAVYSLLTRYVGRVDGTATSFFWTGTVGALCMTPIGLWYWQWMTPGDWAMMLALCMTGVTGHWLLIKVYELAEASAVQPLAYLQLPFAASIGIWVFNDVLHPNVAVGAAIVVSAGVFALIRARRINRAVPAPISRG